MYIKENCEAKCCFLERWGNIEGGYVPRGVLYFTLYPGTTYSRTFVNGRKHFFAPCPSKIFKSTNFSNNTKLPFLRVTRERELAWTRGIQHFLVACSTTREITIRLISNAIILFVRRPQNCINSSFFFNAFSTQEKNNKYLECIRKNYIVLLNLLLKSKEKKICK